MGKLGEAPEAGVSVFKLVSIHRFRVSGFRFQDREFRMMNYRGTSRDPVVTGYVTHGGVHRGLKSSHDRETAVMRTTDT